MQRGHDVVVSHDRLHAVARAQIPNFNCGVRTAAEQPVVLHIQFQRSDVFSVPLHASFCSEIVVDTPLSDGSIDASALE